MHPDTYSFLAGERIADLHRDAARRRQTTRSALLGRATIHHRDALPAVGASGTPLTGQRGAR